MKPSELLEAARDELDKGWIQNKVCSPQGVCALGAWARATHDMGASSTVAVAALNALRAKSWEIYNNSIPVVNDADDRLKEDMINLFDKAIIGLWEKGA